MLSACLVVAGLGCGLLAGRVVGSWMDAVRLSAWRDVVADARAWGRPRRLRLSEELRLRGWMG